MLSIAQEAFSRLPKTIKRFRVGVLTVHSHRVYLASIQVTRAYMRAAESVAYNSPLKRRDCTVTVEMKWDIRRVEERRRLALDLTWLLHRLLEDEGRATAGDGFLGSAYEALPPLDVDLACEGPIEISELAVGMAL